MCRIRGFACALFVCARPRGCGGGHSPRGPRISGSASVFRPLRGPPSHHTSDSNLGRRQPRTHAQVGRGAPEGAVPGSGHPRPAAPPERECPWGGRGRAVAWFACRVPRAMRPRGLCATQTRARKGSPLVCFARGLASRLRGATALEPPLIHPACASTPAIPPLGPGPCPPPQVVMFLGLCLRPPCVVTEFCAMGAPPAPAWCRGFFRSGWDGRLGAGTLAAATFEVSLPLPSLQPYTHIDTYLAPNQQAPCTTCCARPAATRRSPRG